MDTLAWKQVRKGKRYFVSLKPENWEVCTILEKTVKGLVVQLEGDRTICVCASAYTLKRSPNLLWFGENANFASLTNGKIGRPKQLSQPKQVTL